MAENQDQAQEKSQAPSPKKIREARERGEVPRSKELSAMALLVGGVLAGVLAGPFIATRFKAMMSQSLSLSRQETMDVSLMLNQLMELAVFAATSLSAFFIVLFLVGAISPILLGGWNLSWKAIQPKGSRMNPFSGLKRMFSMTSLVELVKGIFKFLLVAGVAVLVLVASEPLLRSLIGMPLSVAIEKGMERWLWAVLMMSLTMVLITAIDVPYQMYSYTKKLRMSFQELKDENKDTEGSPELKGRIKRAQRELSANRMMANVKEADVVITNPTHYAVAIRYDESGAGAPYVVAKGMNEVAHAIKDEALKHEIEIVSVPALARSVYRFTDIDEQIPQALYQAVAKVLAYVYQLAEFKRSGGWRSIRPPTESDLVIPSDFAVPVSESSNEPI